MQPLRFLAYPLFRRSGSIVLRTRRSPLQRSTLYCVASLLLLLSLSCFGESAAVALKKPDPVSVSTLSIADAVHLLHRSGIGASLPEIAELAGLTRSAAVDQIVKGLTDTPTNAMPDWVNQTAPRYWTRGDMDSDSMTAFNNARDRELVELKQWWVREMIETRSPQTERLVLMWHTHLATAYSGIERQSTSMARQNKMFRQKGTGNFRALLRSIVRDPVMLKYLNNTSNKKGSPNENFARELLELFTLGEGNYSETDVKEAARALTGYTVGQVRNMSFEFDRWNHDDGEKQLFGVSGKFNGDDLVDLILEQPSAARHLALRFWKTFVSESHTDSATLQRLAERFRASDYDLKVLYRATLMSDAFWDDKNRGDIVKSPVDLLVGAIRSSGTVPDTWEIVPSWLARLGQDLFEPPNVAGWTGGKDWISPDRLFNRSQGLLDALALGQVPHEVDSSMSGSDVSVGMMMRPSSGTGTTADSFSDEKLIVEVKIAGESFQGKPEFRVELQGGGESVWASGKLALESSFDTEQFGRAKYQSLPWEQLVLGALAPDTVVDSVTIHFLNDKAGGGGDRNIYVDWIRVGHRFFYAENGVQSSGCPPKQAARAGYLYCQGSVSVTRSDQTVAGQELSPVDTTNDLSVGAVRMRWLNSPDSPHPQMLIALTDVTFRSREIDTLTLNILKPRGSDMSLRLLGNGCWPACLTLWPDCSLERHDARSVTFPLRRSLLSSAENERTLCQWNAMDVSDKTLIAVLWTHLPTILEEVSKGRRAQQKWHTFQRWQHQILGDLERLDSTHYEMAGLHSQMSVTGQSTRPAVERAHEGFASRVRPVVWRIDEMSSAYEKLASLEESIGKRNIVLSDLMLPVALFNESSDSQNSGLKAIFLDPAYQVK